ncbi:hypothetical protein B0H14DRAFT_2688563 [Mycena olivaceomarginata]|nr:hypothetical protein B0H14DRAFT_2688563 [Mycena olivaceomarginata]
MTTPRSSSSTTSSRICVPPSRFPGDVHASPRTPATAPPHRPQHHPHSSREHSTGEGGRAPPVLASSASAAHHGRGMRVCCSCAYPASGHPGEGCGGCVFRRAPLELTNPKEGTGSAPFQATRIILVLSYAGLPRATLHSSDCPSAGPSHRLPESARSAAPLFW